MLFFLLFRKMNLIKFNKYLWCAMCFHKIIFFLNYYFRLIYRHILNIPGQLNGKMILMLRLFVYKCILRSTILVFSNFHFFYYRLPCSSFRLKIQKNNVRSLTWLAIFQPNLLFYTILLNDFHNIQHWNVVLSGGFSNI